MHIWSCNVFGVWKKLLKAQTAPLVPRSLVELSFYFVEHGLGFGGKRVFVN
jgi:hypothetical protein